MMSEEEAEQPPPAPLDLSMIDDDDEDTNNNGSRGEMAAAIAAATMNVSGDSTEDNDVLQTLQAKLVLRKNLEQEFHTTTTTNNVSEKIAHFESESKKHETTTTAAAALTLKSSLKPPPSLVLHSSVGADVPTPRFQVFLRIRPSTDDSNTIEILNNTTVQAHPPATSYSGLTKEYSYDAVLPPSVSQLQVYETVAMPLVERFLQGGGPALLFCYGVTNAGKSFTVHGEGNRISGATTTMTTTTRTTTTQGGGGTAAADTTTRSNSSVAPSPPPEDSWGVLPRILYDTYHRVSLHPTQELHLTFFELYQERFYDLLPKEDAAAATSATLHRRPALRLREDKLHGQAFVEGLTMHLIESLPQALQYLKIAKKNRQTATNELNQTSSRSHCVCQMLITDTANSPDTPPSSFWVVDLAGSERHKRTTTSNAATARSSGTTSMMMRHQEACSINKSLMTLMRCLMTLKDLSTTPLSSSGSGGGGGGTSGNNNKALPPFRESKLTHLLMPHWGDASSTVTAMIVNVNPAACDYEESQHVLSYATQAKTIQLPLGGLAAARQQHGEPHHLNAVHHKVEYDENGRRKRGAGGVGLGGGMRAKVGQLLQKLSPKRGTTTATGLKRKAADVKLAPQPSKVTAAAASANKRHKAALAQRGAGTLAKNNPPSTNVKSSKVYKALQMELTVMAAENSFLKADKRELEEQLESLEEQVRAEMVEVMEQQLNTMRHKYEAILQTLRHQKLTASAVKPTPQRRDVDVVRAEQKIEELQDQVQECEEEMIRQREEHAQELEAAKEECERQLKDAAKERDQLRAELANKQELIVNYTRLLHDEEDEEEELDGEEEEEETNGELDSLGQGSDDEAKSCSTTVHEDAVGMDCLENDEEIEDDVNRAADSKASSNEVHDGEIVHVKGGCDESTEKIQNGFDASFPVSDPPSSWSPMEHFQSNSEDNQKFSSSSTADLLMMDENKSPVNPMECRSTQQVHDNVNQLGSSPKPLSSRKPLASLNKQEKPASASFDKDVESRFMEPKKKVKKDPKTGLYQRPKGRQPRYVSQQTTLSCGSLLLALSNSYLPIHMQWCGRMGRHARTVATFKCIRRMMAHVATTLRPLQEEVVKVQTALIAKAYSIQ